MRPPHTRGPYLWQVDYGGTAEELEAYFNSCGEVHRVTILCDKFSGHPKGSVPGRPWGWGRGLREEAPGGAGRPGVLGSLGTSGWPSPAMPTHPSYAYVEFAAESSAQAAVALDKSIFRGRVIKVRPLKLCCELLHFNPLIPEEPGKRKHREAKTTLLQSPSVSGPIGLAAGAAVASGLDVALGGSLPQLDLCEMLG